MQTKKLKIGLIATIAILLVVGAAAAQGFHFFWNEVPFEPNNYSWLQPWEIHEMVDFLDAQLTISGCSYEGQNHDVELVITNVANTPNYYVTGFSYSAKWYVDEANQENIIAGAYVGDPLAINDFVTYVDTWVPTVIGVGDVKLNIIDIVWVQNPIFWTTNFDDGAYGFTISDYTITGATKSGEEGTVSFALTGPAGDPIYGSFTVEIVGVQLIATETDILFNPPTTPITFEYTFTPTAGGDQTMLVTITNAHGA